MRIILAPMQGVIEPYVRKLLTQINNYDLCISEFVRIVDQLLPAKVFYRICPELANSDCSINNTPVRVQLLGQFPEWLAENAHQAIELGSNGIDFNCGCPSKTVNKSQGGASLLKNPELIYQATKAIRNAVPKNQAVSVKIRLGWDNTELFHEIVDAIYQANATEITIHARTKIDGYHADKIKWSLISEITNKINIPVIANGEIFSLTDAKNCQQLTGTQDLMLARGAMTVPNLANMIKHNTSRLPWADVALLLKDYLVNCLLQNTEKPYYLARIKQWLRFLDKEYIEAYQLFEKTKHLTNTKDDCKLFLKELDQSMS